MISEMWIAVRRLEAQVELAKQIERKQPERDEALEELRAATDRLVLAVMKLRGEG